MKEMTRKLEILTSIVEVEVFNRTDVIFYLFIWKSNDHYLADSAFRGPVLLPGVPQ